jgi:hypothetical protein
MLSTAIVEFERSSRKLAGGERTAMMRYLHLSVCMLFCLPSILCVPIERLLSSHQMQPVLQNQSLDYFLESSFVFCANYSFACLLIAVIFGIVAWVRSDLGLKWRISLVIVLVGAVAARVYMRSWLSHMEG